MTSTRGTDQLAERRREMADQDAFNGVHDVYIGSPSAGELERGVVLKWRRRGAVWEGLVSRETADGKMLTEWLPAVVFFPSDSTHD